MKLKLLTLVFIGLLVLGCGDKEKKGEKNIETKEEAKKVELPLRYILQDGNRTVIIEQKGTQFKFSVDKPLVILDFFATWCPPCRAEIPHLVNLQKRYAENLAIIGLLVENINKNEVREFNTRYNINYFVSYANDNMRLANNVADMLHQPHNFSIPMMALFVNGKYFRHYIGMVPEEMLESDIQDALKLISNN